MNNPDEVLLKTDYLKILLDYYYPFYFFALYRAHELYSVEPFIDLLKPPILDVGCGDGFISSLLFGRQIDFGIDPSLDEVDKAEKSKAYRQIFVGDARNIPLESNSLGGVFSNCVLEHISQVEVLLGEISRVLKPNAYFVATALSPSYYDLNPIFRWSDRRGLRWLRTRMIHAENVLHNHVTVLDKYAYANRLASVGMTLEVHTYYCSDEIADFCTGWDTLSKYVIPYPACLTHGGVLTKYLVARYGRQRAERRLDLWYKRFSSLCYRRNEAGGANKGVGQILVAKKGVPG